VFIFALRFAILNTEMIFSEIKVAKRLVQLQLGQGF